jgi:hypothetical protein
MVSDSVWDLRDLIASTPALAVLIGALVTSGPRPVAASACTLLLSGFAIAGGEMLKNDQQRLDYLTVARYITKSGQPGDPAVEAVFFTPGPTTELEAALALQPGHARQQHAVIRLGLPPLSAVLAAPPYAHLPIPDGNTIARQAIQAAAHGTIYFVTTGGPTLAALQAVRSHAGSFQNTNLGQFLHALPPSFRLVRWRRFTRGYVPVSVYTIVGQRPTPLNHRPSA